MPVQRRHRSPAYSLGDQGDRSLPFSDKFYLLVDRNGDGDAADEAERIG